MTFNTKYSRLLEITVFSSKFSPRLYGPFLGQVHILLKPFKQMRKDWICQRGACIFFFTVSYNCSLADNSDFWFLLPATFNTAEAKQERWQLDALISRLPKIGESCAKGEGKPRTDIHSDYLTRTHYRERPKRLPCLDILLGEKHQMNLQFWTIAYKLFQV